MKAEEVASALQAIASAIDTDVFRVWRSKFVEENAGKFAYEDENKLEYTQVFNEFVKGVESHLSEAFEKVDIAGLEEALEAGCKVPDDAQEAVRVLNEVADFQAFKDMMLFEKERMDRAALEPPSSAPSASPSLSVPAMDGLLEATARLMKASEGGVGDKWKCLASSDWYRFESLPAGDGKTEFVRMEFELKLPFIECVDMQSSVDDRRPLWEPGAKSTEVVRGASVYDEDHITRNRLDMGFLFHLAGFPKTLTLRIKKRYEAATQTFTVAVAPWDMDKDTIDGKSAMGLTVVTIRPHPTDPGKSLLAQWQQDPVGKSTGTVAKTFMTYIVPKMYSTRAGKYKANISAKGKVVDYLKDAMDAGHAWAKG
uniref:Cilia- and flagella-associated protein 36 n=1 Tax=Hemiselmis andersenii TaxID=464988 RepID=A0A6U4NF14_HEMAN|mmetsp:Transcript_30559/g.71430  ORF Transcript_30559/g.71430 Transcript_30559/m.71430 type:complete len:369 (+) Transcript_30559:273-1379(+)